MTASELEENLELIGWSIRQTAERFDVPFQTIRRMVTGERPVHPKVAKYIGAIAAVIGAIDVPDLRADEPVEEVDA